MMICQTCQHIFSSHWAISEEDVAEGDEYPELSDAGFIWIEGTPGTYKHHLLNELCETFSKSCTFCAKLWDAIAGNPKTARAGDLGVLSILPRRANSVYDISFKVVDSKYHLERYTLPISLQLQPWISPNASGEVKAAGVSEQLLSWITTCRKHHPCTKGNTGRPTRLLEVTDTIRLREGVEGEYVTLSHRWEESLQLRSDSLDAFTLGIAPESLSRTFTDAINLTRSLGLHYIWIDALCIIQDSPEDWLKESVKMADVYSNSVVNIAATAVHHGLHQVSDRVLNTPFLVEGRRESYTLVDTQAWQRRVEAGPLNKRAWVYQERILAPRTIHFARDQVWWDCERTRGCESGQAIAASSAFQEGDDYHNWCDYVEAYSRTDITFDSDRLIALAGVASMVSQISSQSIGDYFAGLWRQDMPGNLLWTGNKASRQTSYVAPSWSWASMNGGVDFVWIRQKKIHGKILAEVVDAVVETRGDRLGPLLSGRLTVRATLLYVQLSGSTNTKLIINDHTGDLSVFVVWDGEARDSFQGHWTLVATDRDYVYGLILDGGETTFYRAGFLSFPKSFLCQSLSVGRSGQGPDTPETAEELLAKLPRIDIFLE